MYAVRRNGSIGRADEVLERGSAATCRVLSEVVAASTTTPASGDREGGVRAADGVPDAAAGPRHARRRPPRSRTADPAEGSEQVAPPAAEDGLPTRDGPPGSGAVPSADAPAQDAALDAPPTGPPGGARRMEWLDALRGVAAPAVALQHGAEKLWPDYLRWSVEVFRPGEYGVFVFFMVSGFIIPASLEKRGSVRAFWVGRVLRLFPLYWAALVAVAVLALTVDRTVAGNHGRWDFVVNLTMVQNFLTARNVIGASWTLAFEMVFYLLASALLLAGLHRRSAPIATTLLLLGLASATIVPSYALRDASPQTLALAVGATGAVVLVLCLGGVVRSATAVAGIVVTVGLAVPLLLNRPESWWFSLILLGTMFMGTCAYRWYAGQLGLGTLLVVVGTALLAMTLGAYANVPTKVDPTLANAVHSWRPEALTYAVAVGTFALALWLRGRRFPRVLTYLGTISYSVYLVHAIVIYVVPEVGGPTTTFAVWMLVVLLVSTATYHAIEKPFHDLGRRWSSRIAPSRRGAVSA